MFTTSESAHATHFSNSPIQPDLPTETELTEEIQLLWAAHQSGKDVAKRSREEVKALRHKLGEKLSEMKSLLVRSGRGGGWAAYLRSNNLPRSSSDRHIATYEATINPAPTNRLSEAIQEPTEDDIRRLVRSLLPRLRRVLTTRDWVDWFAEEVVVQLNALT